MVRLELQPSLLMSGFVVVVHAMAAAALGFSEIPLWLTGLLVPSWFLSFVHLWRRVRLTHPRSVVALELRGEQCLPVLRQAECGSAVLVPEVYSSPWLQILRFRRDGAGTSGSRWTDAAAVKACLRDAVTPPLVAVVVPDSCPAQQRRQLRKFLRWRIVC